MTRESDEECLALIATIRARAGATAGLAMRSETERLLDNLEARVEEGAAVEGALPLRDAEIRALRAERDNYRAETTRLRGQLADLGTEFVKLTGEVERLQTRLVKAWEQGANEGLGHYRALMRKEVESEGAAEACRQHVREEVAAEVERQLAERVGVAETVWTWVNNVQHELDKLRTALEAKAS